MATALGIDLGEVYRTAESVKASRAARGAAVHQQENAVKFSEAAGKYAAGDQSALPQMIALNPQAAKQVLDAYTAMDDKQKAEQKQMNEQLGQLAHAVLSAKDPAAAYTQIYSQLPPEAKKALPPTYNEQWVRYQLARAVEVDKLYESAEKRSQQAGDRAHDFALEGAKHQNQLAQIVAKAEAEGGGAGGGIKSADASLIYRQSAEILGGTFDQQGNLIGLDPNTRPKVQEIATRASAYFRQGMDHASAVKKAAQELGITFPGQQSTPAGGVPVTPMGNDPLGIR